MSQPRVRGLFLSIVALAAIVTGLVWYARSDRVDAAPALPAIPLGPALAARQAAEETPPVGAFRHRLETAWQRSGFSGRPVVAVFYSPNQDNRALRSALSSDRVQTLASRFTCAWVNTSEAPARFGISPPEEDLPLVFVRDLSGRCLGILAGSQVSSSALAELLESLPTDSPKSPLYRDLLQSADRLDAMIDDGDLEGARFAIEMLQELEPGTAAATRAESRLSLLPPR